MLGDVLTENLLHEALLRLPAEHPSLTRLCILSGYASAAMASRHILELRQMGKGIDLELIYGMAGMDGVSKPNHLGFRALKEKREFPYAGSFSCGYILKPMAIHSKLYVWCQGNTPRFAFVGSANYTENGLTGKPNRREVLATCDPASALKAFQAAMPLACDCAAPEAEQALLRPHAQKPPLFEKQEGVTMETDPTSPFCGHPKAVLSLLTASGSTGHGSNLNWGIRKNGTKRNPNQAYLAIRGALRSSDFFPHAPQRFTVLTDDGYIFTCTRAQQSEKAIETPQDNSELGRYFRNRLGLADGAYVAYADLLRYGRTSVTFYKLSDEEYVMDFSPNKR